MGGVLRCELNSNLEFDHPEFDVTYLAVPQVVDAATAVFEKCREGEDPLYTTGGRWRGWEERDEKGVQRSLEECVSKFMKFLDEAGIESPSQRRFVPSTNTPIPEPVKRKPDLFVATFAGLTLCGSTMRLWEFDRMGATTSVAFDIHQYGLFFVKTLLGFLWMNDEQLGFDSDLMDVDGQRFVKINRDGKEERLIITETLKDHAASVGGRELRK